MQLLGGIGPEGNASAAPGLRGAAALGRRKVCTNLFFFNPVRGEAVSGQQRALRAAPRRLPQGYVLVLRVFCGGARVARRALMYVQSCGFAAKCLARHKGHIYIGYIGAPHRGPQDSVYTLKYAGGVVDPSRETDPQKPF